MIVKDRVLEKGERPRLNTATAEVLSVVLGACARNIVADKFPRAVPVSLFFKRPHSRLMVPIQPLQVDSFECPSRYRRVMVQHLQQFLEADFWPASLRRGEQRPRA